MKMPLSTEAGEISPDELKRQAWDWLCLLTSREADETAVRGFRDWVGRSATHRAVYGEVKARWDVLKASTGALLQTDPNMVTAYERTLRTRARGRRAFLGMATASAAAAGVAMVFPPLGLWPSASEWVRDWDADYRTATGEQRSMALTSGVDVTLNTRSSARREMEDGRVVGMDLLAGEAAVDLQAGQRFAVTAGAGRSTGKTGRFEVRYVQGKVCVTCIDGVVRVAHPAGARVLQASQQTVYDTQAIGGIADIEPADVSAWRRGVLVFRQTRLADAVEEINRYRAGRVLLMNDAARDKAVTGHFEIASLDRALTQLQYMFDLRARPLAGGILVLS